MGDMSISDRLSRLGYEHRKAGEHPFARHVVHRETGRVIGLLGACEAARFCGRLESGATEPDALEAALQPKRYETDHA